MTDPRLPAYRKFCRCAACGEYFSNVRNFDLHRRGAPERRHCVEPDKLVKKNKKARLRLNAEGYWVRDEGVYRGFIAD
jgi:hypothetical protein